ncbi:hypothetical protein UPYG_G00028140 [Umbra pygmaea]|uniref:Lysosome-associated membrane glycoprotein 2-like luminal domain-containing protein n=1 Tax=Umbra pygmaea TaxID=75934 RepID=A0ABD0XPJ9_UMBPY
MIDKDNMHFETKVFLLVLIILGNSLNTASLDPNKIPTSKPNSPTIQQRPVLQPKETVPVTGTYVLKNLTQKPCIKVSMGVEYIVIQKKKRSYFNLDPTTTQISGKCDEKEAILSLGILGNGGYLELTFQKTGNQSYLSKVRANLAPGKGNINYPGVIDHEKLFQTDAGCSLKCSSQTEFNLAENLHVKIGSLQFQAFKLTAETFGPEVECWKDFLKRIIPIIIGATAVGLLLIAIVTFLIIRDRRRHSGYDRI